MLLNQKIRIRKSNIIKHSKIQMNLLKLDKQKSIEKIKKIMEFTDDEKNLFDYNLAIQNDQRTFCEYYISLLKTKHPLVFTFCYNKDYNSKIIKIDLFFIIFIINYNVNALFFNDNTMHRIYEDKGSFDFIYQLPKIIYSSLISMILNIILKLLALSNDAILKFKKNKSKIGIDKKQSDLNTKIKIKFILYFIVSSIFIIFFWYYLSMFCAIYRNTQFHLIKDTLISFGLSLIYPFVIYLIPGLFRIPSLAEPKVKKSYLYRLSKIIQMI